MEVEAPLTVTCSAESSHVGAAEGRNMGGGGYTRS